MEALFKLYLRRRWNKLKKNHADPFPHQDRLLRKIISTHSETIFGKEHAFDSIHSYDEFAAAVRVREYEDHFPYIDRMIHGENNVLCKDNVEWFAKSSGSTTGRSKYLPVPISFLKKNHLAGAWDAAAMIYNQDPKARLFRDKSLIMGGSLESIGKNKTAGDISAINLRHFPRIAQKFHTPDFETALMPDWEEKIRRMIFKSKNERVTLIAGVPTWTIVLFKELLKVTGKKNILEIWPHLRSYLHGGVDFKPYNEIFREYLPSENVVFREVYNASEAYFAVQDDYLKDGMLLLCDHEVFYEFMPLQEMEKRIPEVFPLSEIETGRPYALIITTNSGLYRYNTGDIVEFVHKTPLRIKVRGRTRQQINVFGEELSIANASTALADTAGQFNSVVSEFTVAPVFMSGMTKGAHDWFIEFEKQPDNLSAFERALDRRLREINSDYDAKRTGDLALTSLRVHVLQKNTFEKWYKARGKYGGQNKIPRLRNDRTIADELIRLQEKAGSVSF